MLRPHLPVVGSRGVWLVENNYDVLYTVCVCVCVCVRACVCVKSLGMASGLKRGAVEVVFRWNINKVVHHCLAVHSSAL